MCPQHTPNIILEIHGIIDCSTFITLALLSIYSGCEILAVVLIPAMFETLRIPLIPVMLQILIFPLISAVEIAQDPDISPLTLI